VVLASGAVLLFRQFVNEDLGCASYLVGDTQAGVAVVVDPAFAIEQYLDVAEREGVRIERVLETHTHADHVSGHGRFALEHGLRKALLNQELAVFYQPIFDFRTGKISGMEALLRWNHPTLGMIPPAVFIPLAEAIGVMVPIGTWAMRVACAQAKAWHDSGYRTLSLAVNLSVCQLQQPDLLLRVEEVLNETGLPARLLELEITESSAMQSPETSVRTLYELKKLGVRISLDDFGTGHSSLSYLKRFPIDTLKIDQSFVRDITHDPDTAAIVTAIIAMAHSLLKVIAEGVEFTEQSTFLKRYSCDQMQGYLLKAPVPVERFTELLGSEPDSAMKFEVRMKNEE